MPLPTLTLALTSTCPEYPTHKHASVEGNVSMSILGSGLPIRCIHIVWGEFNVASYNCYLFQNALNSTLGT